MSHILPPPRVYAMSIYRIQGTLPLMLSPGQNWADADRSQPGMPRSTSYASPVLGGPQMQVWRAREWAWLVSAWQRWPKKD